MISVADTSTTLLCAACEIIFNRLFSNMIQNLLINTEK